MKIYVVTLFPKILQGFLQAGLLKRAQEKKRLEVSLIQLRDFAQDKRRTVDDAPYGGGGGMVMTCGPLFDAVRSLALKKKKVVLLSPQGSLLTQAKAKTLAEEKNLVLICGRYEGVDERVAMHLADEEISIGDFVLAGGELPAAVLIETVARMVPGVLGNPRSAAEDSFYEGVLDYPHYTRPEKFRKWGVPKVLLSGDHSRVSAWRKAQAFKRTTQRRPDLLAKPSREP